MKKSFCFLLIILICFVLFVGCTSKEASKATTIDKQISSESDNIDVNEFSRRVEGVWMNVDDYNIISFLNFHDENQLLTGIYASDAASSCEITSICEVGTDEFSLELYFPAVPKSEMYDAVPESFAVATISSIDGYTDTLSIKFENQNEISYTYVAKTYDDATKVFDEILFGDNTESLNTFIPELSATIDLFNLDFEVVKIQMGIDLIDMTGSSLPETIFKLQNIDDVQYFMNREDDHENLGARDGKIVWYGYYGINADLRVKDLIPDEALTLAPAVFSQDGTFSAYIWKCSNGYISITTLDSGYFEFYESPAYQIVYVEDINMLSFVS